MACLKLGSKSEVFHLSGLTWLCSTGLKPDVMIQVEDQSFHLHKFPLLSRSGYLETLFSKASETTCVAQLHDIPGGPETFLLVAKFCYGVRIEVTAENAVSLRCAAEYLQMSENYGDANLIYLTESFLSDHVFTNWDDSIKALECCEPKLLPLAEELHIVSRCIASLAVKACVEDTSLFNWPISLPEGTTTTTTFWNGIQTKATSENWWFNDVSSFLDFQMYKRFIKNVESRGVKADIIAASVTHYAKRNLPLLGCSRHSSTSSEEGTINGDDMYYSHEDQRSLLEEIVELLPSQERVTSTKFLLRLLRTSMVLHASAVTQENLEKKIGVQLDEAALEDLLIPNMGYSAETLYDIDSVQRILDHFMLTFDSSSSCYSNIVEEKPMMGDSHPLRPIKKVASLIDGYLAEVASDENLKLSKFQALGALIPEDVRPMDDGIYRAIDIFIKAHPWLTESEREQLCLLMDCQKLSLEACTHAAQNERLPLRVIVQVLFFEQMRLRTSIAGWFFDSDSNNDDTSGKIPALELGHKKIANANVMMNGMRNRVYELEKECMSMKQDLDKLVKTKEGRNFFSKIFGLRFKTKTSPCGGSGKGGDEDALMTRETKN